MMNNDFEEAFSNFGSVKSMTRQRVRCLLSSGKPSLQVGIPLAANPPEPHKIFELIYCNTVEPYKPESEKESSSKQNWNTQ